MQALILSLFILTSSQIIRKAWSVFSSNLFNLIAIFKTNRPMIKMIINKIVVIIFPPLIKEEPRDAALITFVFISFLAIFVLSFRFFAVLRKNRLGRIPFTAHLFKYCQRKFVKKPVFSLLVDR